MMQDSWLLLMMTISIIGMPIILGIMKTMTDGHFQGGCGDHLCDDGDSDGDADIHHILLIIEWHFTLMKALVLQEKQALAMRPAVKTSVCRVAAWRVPFAQGSRFRV